MKLLENIYTYFFRQTARDRFHDDGVRVLVIYDRASLDERLADDFSELVRPVDVNLEACTQTMFVPWM